MKLRFKSTVIAADCIGSLPVISVIPNWLTMWAKENTVSTVPSALIWQLFAFTWSLSWQPTQIDTSNLWLNILQILDLACHVIQFLRQMTPPNRFITVHTNVHAVCLQHLRGQCGVVVQVKSPKDLASGYSCTAGAQGRPTWGLG